MAVTIAPRTTSRPARVLRADVKREGPSYRAFQLLYLTYFFIPLVAGFDKFFGYLVSWSSFLAPAIGNSTAASGFLKTMGVVEIALAVAVAMNPRRWGWAVCGWLWLGIINMLLIPGHFGIALCLFAMSCGAAALTHLAKAHETDVDTEVDISEDVV